MSIKNKIVLWAFDNKHYWLVTLLLSEDEINDLLEFMDKLGMPKSKKFIA